MFSRHRSSSFLAAILFSSSCALAQPAAPTAKVLTLEECVARAMEKNFEVQLQRFTTDNAKDSLEIAKAIFDPNLSANATKSFSQSAITTSFVDANGNIVTNTGTRNESIDANAAVSELVPTGATVSANSVLNRDKSSRATSRFNPNYTGNLSLSVRQPLLRGAGTRVTRAQIERAKLGITGANYDFKSTVLTVVRNVESAYYTLAFNREQFGVRRFSLEVQERLVEENRAKRSTGVATDLDVLTAEVGVANARQNLLLAEQAVHNSEDALLALITQFGFNETIGPMALPEETPPAVSFDVSYKQARDNSPDYAAQKVIVEQLKIDADVARKNRLPQLDAIASGGYTSSEDSYNNAVRRTWNGDGYNWQLGASLTLPWGFRADRARYRQALTGVNRESAHLEQIDQSLVVQVRSAVRAVQTNQESVRISALATELSQKQFDLEKARFDAGLSTFRFVQQSQDNVDTARVNELQAKVALRNALSDLSRLEGSSLPRYKINLAQ